MEKIIGALEAYKQALANFDIRLTEMQLILQGYHGILNSPPEEPAQELDLEVVNTLLAPSDDT